MIIPVNHKEVTITSIVLSFLAGQRDFRLYYFKCQDMLVVQSESHEIGDVSKFIYLVKTLQVTGKGIAYSLSIIHLRQLKEKYKGLPVHH